MVLDDLVPHQPPCRSGLNFHLGTVRRPDERVHGVGPWRLVQQFQCPDAVIQRHVLVAGYIPKRLDEP